MDTPRLQRSYSPSEVDAVAAWLVEHLQGHLVWALVGNLGAGKTTLVQAICRQLGVVTAATSPSYALMHEYAGRTGPIYHFDLYRLRHSDEALQIGLPDYLDSGHLCLIEWPHHAAALLPSHTVRIVLALQAEADRRTIAVYW